ncbi:MAG: hypothetical protein PHS93_07705 [Candidatus Omnitrophica bacterium]|nr:hypothetical protein [Candidatus Omnitrophota bacterium]
MAKIPGKTGAIYYPAAYIKGKTISFTATTTISDSGNGFVTAGFVQGQSIVISGSTSNNGTQTINTGGVAAGAITTAGSPPIVNEDAGDDVIIVVAAPGTLASAFMDWEVEDRVDTHDVSDFDSATIHSFFVGLSGWTGTANRWMQSTADAVELKFPPGTIWWLRFFIKYLASPSATNPAYYYEGAAVIKNVKVSEPADDMVKVTYEFEGISDMSACTTKSTSW